MNDGEEKELPYSELTSDMRVFHEVKNSHIAYHSQEINALISSKFFWLKKFGD